MRVISIDKVISIDRVIPERRSLEQRQKKSLSKPSVPCSRGEKTRMLRTVIYILFAHCNPFLRACAPPPTYPPFSFAATRSHCPPGVFTAIAPALAHKSCVLLRALACPCVPCVLLRARPHSRRLHVCVRLAVFAGRQPSVISGAALDGHHAEMPPGGGFAAHHRESLRHTRVLI
jgi:hypothetical protein